MTGETTAVAHPTEQAGGLEAGGLEAGGLESFGVEAVEVRDSAVRNVVIAVVGLVIVIAALVPLVYGAIWAGSIVYAAVLSFLTGSPDAAEPGTAV